MLALGPQNGQEVAVSLQHVGFVVDARGPIGLVGALPVRNDVISQFDGCLVKEYEVNVIDRYTRADLVGETGPAGRHVAQAFVCDEHRNVEVAEWTCVSVDLRTEHVPQTDGLFLGKQCTKAPTQFGNRGDVHGMLAD